MHAVAVACVADVVVSRLPFPSAKNTGVRVPLIPYRHRPYPSASQIALSVPWRVSAADQTFSVNRKYFIVSCICAQKQYVDFKSVILDLFRTGFALARLGQRARRWEMSHSSGVHCWATWLGGVSHVAILVKKILEY